MNPSCTRTNPAPAWKVIRKIRPAGRNFDARRPCPGSGSLGEFIEKITPTVVISRLPLYVKKRMTLSGILDAFLPLAPSRFTFAVTQTAYSPAPHLFFGNLPHIT